MTLRHGPPAGSDPWPSDAHSSSRSPRHPPGSSHRREAGAPGGGRGPASELVSDHLPGRVRSGRHSSPKACGDPRRSDRAGRPAGLTRYREAVTRGIHQPTQRQRSACPDDRRPDRHRRARGHDAPLAYVAFWSSDRSYRHVLPISPRLAIDSASPVDT